MSRIDASELAAMLRDGRHGEVLALLQQFLAATELAVEPTRSDLFMPLFQWELLAEQYPPARAALQDAREAQVASLLAGSPYVGLDAPDGNAAAAFRRMPRFLLILDMNRTLDDAHSTYTVFVQLEARDPVLARQYAGSALPAMVAAGDFDRADRYRGDPLDMLDAVNLNARTLPLLPPPGQAPRLAADLKILVGDVAIGMAVLRGRYDDAGADALRAALLAGIDSAELRVLAQRELDAPGAIMDAVVAHQMAQDGA
jgi:hypothetical protein